MNRRWEERSGGPKADPVGLFRFAHRHTSPPRCQFQVRFPAIAGGRASRSTMDLSGALMTATTDVPRFDLLIALTALLAACGDAAVTYRLRVFIPGSTPAPTPTPTPAPTSAGLSLRDSGGRLPERRYAGGRPAGKARKRSTNWHSRIEGSGTVPEAEWPCDTPCVASKVVAKPCQFRRGFPASIHRRRNRPDESPIVVL